MMAGQTPAFWWTEPGLVSATLSPLAWTYGAVARWRLDHGARVEAGVPVLCVGNFTVGGGGKTPTALALARAAREAGLRPGFLSRGYGGALEGPVTVDPRHHHAGAVGDEPMLLAAEAPTAVSRDRAEGAAHLRREAGIDFIIMDDGFQSARLAMDFALLVVDAGRGLGNAAVVPAGPLRAPLTDQLRHADALVVIGRGSAGDAAIRRTARGGKPVFEARLDPLDAARLAGRRVLAFAGIADPRKFYSTLRDLGAEIVRTKDFPDHHPFSEDALAELGALAEREALRLVTTAKDAARLRHAGPMATAFLERIDVLEVELRFEPPGVAARLVRETVESFRRRAKG